MLAYILRLIDGVRKSENDVFSNSNTNFDNYSQNDLYFYSKKKDNGIPFKATSEASASMKDYPKKSLDILNIKKELHVVTNHNTFGYSNNNGISMYLPNTTKSKFKFISLFYNKSTNKFEYIYCKNKTIDLSYTKLGSIKLNTSKVNIYSHIYENSEFFHKYRLDSNFDLESIKADDLKGYIFLKNMLDNSNFEKFNELVDNFNSTLIDLHKKGKLNIVINNFHNYENLSTEQKIKIELLNEEMCTDIIRFFFDK